jgi:acyl-CoA hydrolase
MPQRLSIDEAVAAISSHARRGRVYLSAGPAEPLALHDGWLRTPETAAGLSFAGMFIPGVNRRDYTRLHPEARMELFMLSADWREGFTQGRAPLRPMHYAQACAALVREGAPVGVFHVSTPDADGLCSFGFAADAPPLMLPRVGWKIALVNRAMPALHGAPSVPLAAFDAIVEVDHPLADLPEATASASANAIAQRVAAFVSDGDTVQTGVGKLPSAVTRALAAKRDLRIHSGMITASHMALADAGAIADAPGAITCGIAVGDAAFYARAAEERRLRLVPVTQTHAPEVLAGIDNLVAINAALEIDLFGQINAEFAAGAQISGTGGLVDFIRGARASRNGRAIVMIQADGRGVSRIVPKLERPPTVARADAPIVVTEYGAVDLAPLNIDDRASAIIALAAPTQQSALSEAWARMRTAL